MTCREALPIVHRHRQDSAGFDGVHDGSDVVPIGDRFVAIPSKVPTFGGIMEESRDGGVRVPWEFELL